MAVLKERARQIPSEHKDVVHLAEDALQPHEDLAHPPLKVLRGTGDAKWEVIEAIPSGWCDTCRKEM